MTIHGWEYCGIYLNDCDSVEYKKQGKKGWLYDLRISYSGENIIQETISTNDYLKDETGKQYHLLWSINNLWQQSIGLLGLVGWELVSIQHPLGLSFVITYRGVAYFKRPRIEGRPVDEPKLKISIEPERVYD
jgi:hypothetical protein